GPHVCLLGIVVLVVVTAGPFVLVVHAFFVFALGGGLVDHLLPCLFAGRRPVTCPDPDRVGIPKGHLAGLLLARPPAYRRFPFVVLPHLLDAALPRLQPAGHQTLVGAC